jgi:hydroxypyruvate reductase
MSNDDAALTQLHWLWREALAAADPAAALEASLPVPPAGRTVVLAVGKAAARMAEVIEGCWQTQLEGLVVVPPGIECQARRLRVVTGSHPVPDARSVAAAQAALQLAQGLGADDLLLCLLSGGGSALLAAPAPGVSLADKQAINAALLACGAPIEELNCVRKHLSAIKGGRLARAAFPARIVSRAVSDVIGDVPSVIASGPTVGDETTCEQALAILNRYDIGIPAGVAAWLACAEAETPAPDNPLFAAGDFEVIVRPAQVLEHVAACARARGFVVDNLGDRWDGEAREVAGEMARRAQTLQADLRDGRPRLLLSGGELTVQRSAAGATGGQGGPNAEFILAFGLAVRDRAGLHALAVDTDGIDGSGPQAGAVWTPALWQRAQRRGLDLAGHLARHDSHGALAALDAALVTGPSGTNVNDFRAILIDPTATG